MTATINTMHGIPAINSHVYRDQILVGTNSRRQQLFCYDSVNATTTYVDQQAELYLHSSTSMDYDVTKLTK